MTTGRKGIFEQIGAAFHADRLSMKSNADAGETPLLRIAALGMATAHLRHGADRERQPLATVLASGAYEARPQDLVASELAASLCHVRYGGQANAVARSVELFAAYMGYRARFAMLADRERILTLFAARVLHEWLSNRCQACAGSGKLERSPSGQWIKPTGRGQRNAVYRTCTTCHGSRLALPSHTARRQALGLSLEQYDAGQWAKHFRAAHTWLDRAVGRLARPLTTQLERRKRPA